MSDLNVVLTAEVGDGAGDFEQAVVGAGGEAEMLNGGAKQGLHEIGRRTPGAGILLLPP